MSIRSANRSVVTLLAAIFAVTPVLQVLAQAPPAQAKPAADRETCSDRQTSRRPACH